MVSNNSADLSLWQTFVKRVKKVFKSIRKTLRKYSKKYPDVSQFFQLTTIYIFASLDLVFAVLKNVYSLGYVPEILMPIYPYIKSLLMSPFLRVWASPEKVFFLSYVVIEYMVIRKTFKFSKLVKYNILLIFALLMIQGLAIAYWDVLFNRQIAAPISRWVYDKGAIIYMDKPLAITFFLNTFLIFMCIYIFLYITALRGKFATVPGMEWLTDSVCFWLKIVTPTMRFGKGNGWRDEKNDKEKK